MINLKLDVYGINRPGGERMRELGVTYRHAIYSSLGDCCFFFDCANVPDPLTEDLRLAGPAEEFIGYGLSREDVAMLTGELPQAKKVTRHVPLAVAREHWPIDEQAMQFAASSRSG